ncbi:MAG TPA: hypothetical protein VIF09_24495 [Polyangiaceae bacterium]
MRATGFVVCLGSAAALVVACSGSGSSGGAGVGGSSSSGGATGSSGGNGGSSSGSSGGTTGSSGGGASSSGGASSGSASSSGGGSSSGSSGGDAGFGAYPAGPYGTAVGDTIQDMKWIGYVDDAASAVATTLPYVSYSLDDARKSGKHYAMINLAESDCPGCQKSAGEMATGAAAVVAAGGVVIEVLETTGFSAPAKTDLDAWVNNFMLVNTAVKDLDGTGTPTFNTLGPRDHAYIIDLTTMKIVDYITGSYSNAGTNNSGALAMTEMHTLLGK